MITEKNYWFWSLVVAAAGVFVTAAAAYFAKGAFDQAMRQADTAQKQLVANSPPKLRVLSLHVWNHGQGFPLGRDNAVPDLSKRGNIIEGTAIARNFGGSNARIVSSDLFLTLRTSPLTMNYPGWGDPGNNKLHFFRRAPEFSLDAEPIVTMRPGEAGRWMATVEVPKIGPIGDLYAFGNVFYEDTLGVQHGVYFAQRYDPEKSDFVSANGSKDGIWNEF